MSSVNKIMQRRWSKSSPNNVLVPCSYSLYRSVLPKVSGLATWSENCKWYSSLPQGAVLSLFCESF